MTGQFKEFIKQYWTYYRELENELYSCKKYVDFTLDNKNTYSIEFLKLYLAVCSEIDVIGKQLAKIANTSFKPKDKGNNIFKWWFEVESYFNLDNLNLQDYQCVFVDEINAQPWQNFKVISKKNKQGHIYFALDSGKQSPKWWSLYNKVKHNRTLIIPNSSHTYYTQATLWNLICAFAALYILEKVYMNAQGTNEDIKELYDISVLFERKAFITTNCIDSLF